MKKYVSLCALFSMPIIFTACDTKSQEYYQKNPAEAKIRAKECKEKSITSQDCINAYSVAIESIRETNTKDRAQRSMIDPNEIPNKDNVLQ